MLKKSFEVLQFIYCSGVGGIDACVVCLLEGGRERKGMVLRKDVAVYMLGGEGGMDFCVGLCEGEERC